MEAKDQIEEVPVLIIGGSLVGLTLAAILAKNGIECLVIEKHSSTAIHPRATVMMPRTMQVFKELGLYDTMREESLKYYDEKTCIITLESLAGELLHKWLADVNEGIENVSATRRVFLTQQALEPLLRSKAKENGASLRFSTAMQSISETSTSVLTTVKDRESGSIYNIRSQYTVACDGFRSATRSILKIPMVGPGLLSRALTVYFEILDKEKLARLPNAAYSGVLYVANETVRAFFRFDRDKKESFLVINSAGPRGSEESRFPADTASDEKAAEYLRAAIGDPEIRFKIHELQTWDASVAVPEHLCSPEGRIFLGGDAAHQMPPSGGFGGNTGVQDAHNLGWKLAYVLKGIAGPQLLGTYEQERRPIAKLTTENAMAHYVHRTEPSWLHMLDTWKVQEVDIEALELAYRYPRSSAIAAEGNEDDRNLTEDPTTAIARAGSVAHHVLVDPLDGKGRRMAISEFFNGESFVLFTGPDGQAWVEGSSKVENAERLVRAIQLDFTEKSRIANRYQIRTDGAVLVRPDGFVAWSAPSMGGKSAMECQQVLNQVFQRILY